VFGARRLPFGFHCGERETLPLSGRGTALLFELPHARIIHAHQAA
jgi:hypothetical protein